MGFGSVFDPYRSEVEDHLGAGSPVLLRVEPGFPWRQLVVNAGKPWCRVIPDDGAVLNVSSVRAVVEAADRGVISEAWVLIDRSGSAAQNALLKFLEDVAPSFPTVLLSYPSTLVLPTIRSRCYPRVLTEATDPIYEYVLGNRIANLPRPWTGTLAEAVSLVRGERKRVNELFRALHSGEALAAFRAAIGVTRDDARLLALLLRRHVSRLDPIPELVHAPQSIVAAWVRVLESDPSPAAIRWGLAALLHG